MTAPAWLCGTLNAWVCPGCPDPSATDCDSTVLAAEEVMEQLRARIVASVEDGYYKDHDIIWWLEQDDALAWREDE